jgi:Ser/Thr protein kinase RdoA (MazF antagonist)
MSGDYVKFKLLFSTNKFIFDEMTIKKCEQSYNNQVYFVSLDSNKYILKIFNSKQRYEKEHFALCFLHEQNISVQKVQDFGKTSDGKFFLILDFIEAEDVINALKEITDKKEFFRKLGELRARLHLIQNSNFGEIIKSDKDLVVLRDWESFIDKRVEKMFWGDKNTREYAFYEKFKHLLALDHGPCFCQGDSSFSNILFSEEGFTLIDFEFAFWGSGVYDICTSIRSFEILEPFLEDFMDGYSQFHTIPSNWKKLIYFYQWIRSQEFLHKISTFSWTGLSENETSQRKNNLILSTTKNILKLENIIST